MRQIAFKFDRLFAEFTEDFVFFCCSLQSMMDTITRNNLDYAYLFVLENRFRFRVEVVLSLAKL